MAALPIQGLAAAIQSSCGPSHHASVPDMPSANSHAHAHDSSMASEHVHNVSSHEALANTQLSDSLMSSDDASSPQSSTCSACAACCVGAVAPPSISVLTPTYNNSEAVLVSSVPWLAGFVPAGLERPPKLLSA